MVSQVKPLKRSELVLSSIKQRYYNLLHRSSGGINGLICLSHLAQAWSVCVCVCVGQSCLTLCNPMGCSPPHSSFHGILQARILEWVAIPFSRAQAWYITHNYIHPLHPVPPTPSVLSLLTLTSTILLHFSRYYTSFQDHFDFLNKAFLDKLSLSVSPLLLQTFS